VADSWIYRLRFGRDHGRSDDLGLTYGDRVHSARPSFFLHVVQALHPGPHQEYRIGAVALELLATEKKMKLTPEQEALEAAKTFRPVDADVRTQIEQAFMCGTAFGRNQTMRLVNEQIAELNKKFQVESAEAKRSIEELKGLASYGFVLAKKKR
jgi:hypothetical protein